MRTPKSERYGTSATCHLSVRLRDGAGARSGLRQGTRHVRVIRIKLPYGEPAWLAVRYDDVRLVLGDRRLSRAMAVEADVPRMTPSKLDAGIIVKDPSNHTRLRRLVAKAFTMQRVEQSRVRIREPAGQLVDAMVARDMPVDLVEHSRCRRRW